MNCCVSVLAQAHLGFHCHCLAARHWKVKSRDSLSTCMCKMHRFGFERGPISHTGEGRFSKQEMEMHYTSESTPAPLSSPKFLMCA